MPGGDGTGPLGQGPLTGRAAGFCADYEVPGFANPIPGRGRGMGRGFGAPVGGGRGRRNRFFATGQPGWMRDSAPSAGEPATEQETLRNQIQALQSQLNQVQNRLSELDDSAAEK